MSKRKIIAAAKRKGLTVESAHYGWSATPGEMVPGWEVQFGPEIDELFCEAELQYFDSTSEALQWLDALVALPRRPDWFPIADAPQDGTRLMLWDSVSQRPVFGSWRGDNPAITHYAAEPAGPGVS